LVKHSPAAGAWADAFALPVETDALAFARELAAAAAENAAKIDELIAGSSKNWRIDRMSRVDRNILRLGACELLAFRDVPVKVVINEAVELAKRFGTAESSAFVNRLDRIAGAIGSPRLMALVLPLDYRAGTKPHATASCPGVQGRPLRGAAGLADWRLCGLRLIKSNRATAEAGDRSCCCPGAGSASRA
jgi:N utilization substance protein B